jgi:hypothetical protein
MIKSTKIRTILFHRLQSYEQKKIELKYDLGRERNPDKQKLIRTNLCYVTGRAAEAQGMIYVIKGLEREDKKTALPDLLKFSEKG